ncbi:MAG TPA: hypothetical protein VM575_20665 [Nocardioides sp.]|nr:hypothetical protein [Nocardioides sp.]
MDDAGAVRGAEPHQHLTDERRELRRAQASGVLDPTRQRLAVEELHHDVAIAVVEPAEIQNLEDVIIADAAGRLRFPLEALHHLGVAGEGRVQHLDRDAAIDADVLALVDGTHAALADQPVDPILAFDDLADLETHELTLRLTPYNGPRQVLGEHTVWDECRLPRRASV